MSEDTSTTPELPDDPRDCCPAARKLIDDDFEEAETLVRDVLAVAFSCSVSEYAPPPDRIASLIGKAEDAMEVLHRRLDGVRQLVRHGAMDNREMDAMLAVRAKALDEGRDPDEATREHEAQTAGKTDAS